MKKPFTVTLVALILISCSIFSISCNDDEVPIDTTPLVSEPPALSVATGTTGLAAVSGGVTPYSIQIAPDSTIAIASIQTIGILDVTPVAAGSTSVTVQDNSDPPRMVTIPITVTIGYGNVTFGWTINGQSPGIQCPQVNSSQVRVTIDGYSPVTRPCNESAFTIETITAGNHTITAELLNPSSTVLSTITQSIFVEANETVLITGNFTAPLIIGSVNISWTINGQPAGSGCLNAISVRAALGALTPITEPCSSGELLLTAIPAGTYSLASDLLDAGNTVLDNIIRNVTIVANQTTYVNLNFTTGAIAGSATVHWTVNGGPNCTPNGDIRIVATGPSPSEITTTCDAYSHQFTNLGPGTYSFEIFLTDASYPGQQSSALLENVSVVDNANTSVSQNLNCLFCTGTDSAGWVQVDVTCGGAACGLTGTLYVIIKDCGTGNVPLNTESVPGATLSAGTPLSHTVSDVFSGGRCVVVFLDVDGNGQISTGDAISSLGETYVLVSGGQTATVDIMLDSVSP
ncbi:MAG: hypothetical protein EPO24_15195 [Bacteroidetes bacterium]|nr:MAG: hypothetical protein EPO24_15195 [Bacteroidota bacterium]